MKKWMKLIALEWFVLRKDPKVRIKLMISFLLVLYVLLFSMVETGSNVLPFFFFGFFFVSPLIDYSFYMQRVRKRFPVLLGKGYTLTQIFFCKNSGNIRSRSGVGNHFYFTGAIFEQTRHTSRAL